MTILDLITDAMVLDNITPPGQVPSNDEAQQVFRALNRMLDQWNTQGLNLYTRLLVPYALSANKQQYFIGPGAADFNTVRPTFIESATVTIPGTTISEPMKILTPVEWQAIKETGVKGIMPTKLYPDYAYPIASLRVVPIPTGTIQMVLEQWSPLPKYTALTDVFTAPEGVEKAILYNLAINIMTMFSVSLQAETIQENAAIAASTKAEMQAFNAKIFAGSQGTGNADTPVAGMQQQQGAPQ